MSKYQVEDLKKLFPYSVDEIKKQAVEEYRDKLLAAPTSKYWDFADMVNKIADEVMSDGQ